MEHIGVFFSKMIETRLNDWRKIEQKSKLRVFIIFDSGARITGACLPRGTATGTRTARAGRTSLRASARTRTAPVSETSSPATTATASHTPTSATGTTTAWTVQVRCH